MDNVRLPLAKEADELSGKSWVTKRWAKRSTCRLVDRESGNELTEPANLYAAHSVNLRATAHLGRYYNDIMPFSLLPS